MPDPHWTQSVHHDGSSCYVYESTTLTPGTTVTLRLRTGIEAPIERVFVRTAPDGEQIISPLQLIASDAVTRWWEGTLQITTYQTRYRFLLLTNEGNWWLSAGGLTRATLTDSTDFCLLADYAAPDWVRDAVFYQIFPDRFADGDPATNVRTGEYCHHGRPVVARTWGEPPRSIQECGVSEFYGGDLWGIIEHLDYLQELGVTALYLTPIFTAPSNHKYDTIDYREVDKHFGGNKALIALRQALTNRGMRLILDLVPNHTGIEHPWFLAAQQDQQAPSAEFFTFHQWPDHYESWLGVRDLLKLNYQSQRLRDEMYAADDSIARQWLKPPFSIDGWRVDVANMLARQGTVQLGHTVGHGLRHAIKSLVPTAYLLGEHFHDGTPQLQGDEFDATMNYRGFSIPLQQWLAGFDASLSWRPDMRTPNILPTEALAEQWHTFLAAIPWQIAQQQFNLLGSHDTPRITTILDNDKIALRIAIALLFTFPGTPSIYYGDEIGLPGGGDPDNRRCMIWDQQSWDTELRSFYQQCIQLRRSSSALRHGGLQILYAANQTLALLRESPEERLLIIARRAPDTSDLLPVRHGGLPNGLHLQEIFSGRQLCVEQGMLLLTGLSNGGVQIWRTSQGALP